MSDDLDMGRADTMAHPTEVVYLHPLGDWADQQLMDDAVGAQGASPISADGIELSVAEGVAPARPLPAPVTDGELVKQAVGAHQAWVHVPTLLQPSYTVRSM